MLLVINFWHAIQLCQAWREFRNYRNSNSILTCRISCPGVPILNIRNLLYHCAMNAKKTTWVLHVLYPEHHPLWKRVMDATGIVHFDLLEDWLGQQTHKHSLSTEPYLGCQGQPYYELFTIYQPVYDTTVITECPKYTNDWCVVITCHNLCWLMSMACTSLYLI